MSSREKEDREEEYLQVFSPDTSIFHTKTPSIQRRERSFIYPSHVPTEQLLSRLARETCTESWITPLTQTEFTMTDFKVRECHKHYISGAHVEHNRGSVHRGPFQTEPPHHVRMNPLPQQSQIIILILLHGGEAFLDRPQVRPKETDSVHFLARLSVVFSAACGLESRFLMTGGEPELLHGFLQSWLPSG